jgi:hypothetical protein
MFAWMRTFSPKTGIGALWCSLMHDSPMWPIHGHYECGVCGRLYRVPWTETELAGAGRVQRAPLPSSLSAILPALLLMAVAAWPSQAAESRPPDTPSPAAVLQRFVAGQGEARGWASETVEIEASLPKLKKTGRLRAIRTIFPMGRPDYKVLESDGDATVKNQVIVRYISAEEKTTEVPPGSVAVTPANYRIHYAGTVRLGNRLAYAFRVIPRQKRVGLINGVLWLDGETGIALRETGYFAKSPSVFLKRINLTRENDLENGVVATRVTHISIETRLVGRAQLVIVEHPPSFPLTASGVAVREQ